MLHANRHYTHYSSANLFHRQWEQVVSALWIRYPNPLSKHVLSDDTLSRKVMNGKLVTTRLISKTTKVPDWASRIVGGRRVGYIVEESVMDPVSRHMVTYSRTISMPWVLQVIEKSIYSTSSDNRNVTGVYKDAWFSSQMYGLSGFVQSFSCRKYVKNVERSEKGLQYVLETKFLPRPRTSKMSS